LVQKEGGPKPDRGKGATKITYGDPQTSKKKKINGGLKKKKKDK